MDKGMPELPTYSITYHVDPYTEYDIQLNVLSSHFEEEIDVYPTQNRIKNLDEKGFVKNLEFYNSNQKFPSNNIWISERQTMRC